MRTATFLGICGFISAGLVFLIQFLLAILELQIPFGQDALFKAMQMLLIFPVVYFILNPVNQKIRLWRKERGRDIEEEEKYETESGFISLTPKD